MIKQLNDCIDETGTFVHGNLKLKYDVRFVIAALLSNAAVLSSAALAAGIKQEYLLGMFEETMTQALVPQKQAPKVLYLDDEGVIGSKH